MEMQKKTIPQGPAKQVKVMIDGKPLIVNLYFREEGATLASNYEKLLDLHLQAQGTKKGA